MRIAFATYEEEPRGTRGDALVAEALTPDARGLSVPWSRPGFDWASVDAVVLRSCWDYHLRLPEFLSWIAGLETLRVPVFNPGRLVRWNADKTYLRWLESQGVRVVPTHWIAPGETCDLKRILGDRGWSKAVVKPSVGASSYQTHVVRADNAAALSSRLSGDGGYLLQPFLDEIVDEGEWSLMFFGGRLSHAVIKRPRPGDFRVQHQFEGTVEPREAAATHVLEAARVLDVLPERPLYARVDGVVRHGAFELMELELIEPYLFFEHDGGAASSFARCLLEALRSA